MDDFKPNSHKFRKEQTQDLTKKVDKVVTGEVVTRKKSGIRRIAESLVAGGAESVREYILDEVIIPKARDTAYDILEKLCNGVKDGAHDILYGKGSHRSPGTYVNYGSYYEERRQRSDERPVYRRAEYSYDDIILATRGDAEKVLSEMERYISKYGIVSVSDLYDMLDIPDNYTDRNYGWYDLSGACVVRVRQGYLLKLPRVKPINSQD